MSREYWSGNKIASLNDNEVFVFGSNPEARHFAGAAKSALAFGAVPVKRGVPGSGIPRGFSPNKKTYALITKNLTAGVVENGITYDKQDFRSVSPEQIKANIAELYETARQYPEKKFLITYQYETWPNGSPKKSLNGYFPQELINFFMSSPVPDNIVFHDSYKDKIEAKYNNTNQVGTEDNKFIFFWLTDSPFSQWHPSIFEVKGVRFTSAEQFMMFCKAKLFKDEEIAQQILALNEEVEHLTSGTGEIIDSRYTILAKFNHGQISKEKILETPSLKKEWGAYQKKIKDLGRKVKNYDEKIFKTEELKDTIQKKLANNPQSKYYQTRIEQIESDIDVIKSDKIEKLNSIKFGSVDGTWIKTQKAILNLNEVNGVYESSLMSYEKAASDLFKIDIVSLQKIIGYSLGFCIEFSILILALIAFNLKKEKNKEPILFDDDRFNKKVED